MTFVGMMRMRTKRLAEVCTTFKSNILINKIDGNSGDYPVFGAKGVVANVDYYQQAEPYISVIKWGAGVGRAELRPAFSSIVATMLGILPNRDIDIDWLCYLLQFMHLEQYTTNAVVPNLYFKDYCNKEILVPDIREQRLRAGHLLKIQKIIDKRQKQLKIIDDLIKARFVEMFGDPVKNDKGFDSKLGSDVFKLSNGKFVPESKRFDSGIPVYGGNGISWYTDEILFDKDTIVVGRVGFQSGNVHLVDGPLWISDNAMYISSFLDDGYDLQFLYAVMEHIDFTRFQDAGDLKKITQKPFMEMRYIKPPFEMQQEYNVFVAQVDKSKSVIQKSLDETQLLFDSLMQKYFG